MNSQEGALWKRTAIWWEGQIILPATAQETSRGLSRVPQVRACDPGRFFIFFKKITVIITLFTRRILVPRLGIESMPPAVEAQSPNHWTPGNSPHHA